jgi:hypothetical protein
MLKIFAMAPVWGFGCVPQPDETQESIDNRVQAGFPADVIQVVDGAVYVGRDAARPQIATRRRCTSACQ